MSNYWTTKEQAILREWYPQEGLPGCIARLPNRTQHSIRNRASYLRLKSPRSSSYKTEKEAKRLLELSLSGMDDELRDEIKKFLGKTRTNGKQ